MGKYKRSGAEDSLKPAAEAKPLPPAAAAAELLDELDEELDESLDTFEDDTPTEQVTFLNLVAGQSTARHQSSMLAQKRSRRLASLLSTPKHTSSKRHLVLHCLPPAANL